MFEQLFKGFIIIGIIGNFHTVSLETSSTKKLLLFFFSKINFVFIGAGLLKKIGFHLSGLS